MSLDLNALRELLAAINQTDIAELTLKSDDFELTVRRGIRVEDHLYAVDRARLQPPQNDSLPPALDDSRRAPDPQHIVESATPQPQEPPIASDILRDSKANRRLIEIISPMVGTFYRSIAPDEPPFVEVGDRIRKGQTVCIIEAMKLMNELEAEIGGEVVEILVQNGEPIEYGQLLLRLNPD